MVIESRFTSAAKMTCYETPTKGAEGIAYEFLRSTSS